MTCIKSTLVLYRSCVQIIRLQDLLSIRHIQKANPGVGGRARPRAPTWRRVTTEILALRADPTLARADPTLARGPGAAAWRGRGGTPQRFVSRAEHPKAPARVKRPRSWLGEGLVPPWRRTATPQKKRAFPQRRGPAGPSRIGVPGLGPRASAPGAGGSRRGRAPNAGRDQKAANAGGPGAAGNSCTWGEYKKERHCRFITKYLTSQPHSCNCFFFFSVLFFYK